MGQMLLRSDMKIVKILTGLKDSDLVQEYMASFHVSLQNYHINSSDY